MPAAVVAAAHGNGRENPDPAGGTNRKRIQAFAGQRPALVIAGIEGR